MNEFDELAERAVTHAGSPPPTMEWIRHRARQRRRRRAAARLAVAVPVLLFVVGGGLWVALDDGDDPGVVASEDPEDEDPEDEEPPPVGEAAVPALVGATWILDALIEGDLVSPLGRMTNPPTIEFLENGTLVGTTPCNSIGGAYVLGETLRITGLSRTEGACVDPEPAILAVLEAPELTVDTDGTLLTLIADSGLGLRYRVQPQPVSCAGDGWQAVDAGPFSFALPPDLVDEQPQGVDSLVVHYRSDDLQVVADYGVFTSDFSEFDPFVPVVESVVVDGREARLLTADVTGGGWDGDFITALHVPLDPPEGWSTMALGMLVQYDDEALAADAACITTTVRFTPEPPTEVAECSDVAVFTRGLSRHRLHL